ncbi:MAG: hypothetical protein WDA47_03095 [Bacilli bacterium]
MSYKRVIQRGDKSYGPYIYESYRDENGIVRKRYLGKYEAKEKKKIPVWIFITIGFVLLLVGFNLINNSFSDSENSYPSLNNKITGFIFSDKNEEGFLNESFEDVKIINKKSSNKNVFSSVSNFFGKITGFVVSENDSLIEGFLEDENQEVLGESFEEEIFIEENNTDDLIENNSFFEENDLNDSLVIDDSILEDNSSLENVIELNDSNSLVDDIISEQDDFSNETSDVIFEPIVNETDASLDIVNDSILDLGEDELVVLREKVIVNKKVKWVVVYNKSNDLNFDSSDKTVKLPAKAENVSVIKGENYVADEVSNILNKTSEEKSLNVSGGMITGNVIADGNYGLFNGVFSFFKNIFGKPSLTGFVTSEIELIAEQKIVRSDFETSVDISEEIEQTDIVAISYYTEGPVSREKKLVNGKIIVVSAEEELNYTDVSAYTVLNDSFKISMSDMDFVKLRWYEDLDLISNSNLSDSSLELKSVSSFLTGLAISNEVDDILELNESDELENETILGNDSLIEDVDLDNLVLEEENQDLDVLSEESYVYVNFNYFDFNNDGYVDYIEWDIPHLSHQSYVLVIEISDAFHLDENREIVDRIYSELSSLDGVVYEIPENNYLRVSFEQMLKDGKDITIYADSNSGTKIGVYEKDSNIVLMTFEDVFNFEENKLFFEGRGTNWAQDTFDLKSVGGSVIYDYIVDPAYEIEFPQTFNIHGKLTDSNGFPLSGSYSMIFKIYNVPSGGSALYTTTKTVNCDSEGIYSVVLDNVNLPFNVQYYLGISVGGDSEMTPRIVLTSTPYAFRAQHVSASGIEFDSDLNMENKNLITEGNITIGGATIYKNGNDLVFRI